MTSPTKNDPSSDIAKKSLSRPHDAKESAAATSASKSSKEPDWANGLRELYDSVVEEPLPDSFNDLLSQLDDKG